VLLVGEVAVGVVVYLAVLRLVDPEAVASIRVAVRLAAVRLKLVRALPDTGAG
jgi:hypothetical protein